MNKIEGLLNDAAYRLLLDFLMYADPWPYSAETRTQFERIAESESLQRNFNDRIEAYHYFKPEAK